jgi:hypothetical protein
MRPVTAEFAKAIDAPKRRIVARVQLDLVGNFVDAGATATGSSTAHATATPAAQAIDARTTPRRKWAAAGFCLPDGSFHPVTVTGSEQAGWWGGAPSDASGGLAPEQTLTVAFPTRKVKTFWWYGDSVRHWYPIDFTVEYHRSDTNTWITVAQVAGWSAPYWESGLDAITPQVVDQIRLTISKVTPAGSCACVLEFDATVTETYENDDIVELQLLEELEADAGTLPVGNVSANEIRVAFNNIDGRFFPGNAGSPYAGLLKPNRRIRPYLGVTLPTGTEYVPLGHFWSGDWSAPADGVEARTSGEDRLKFLAGATYSTSQVYQNTNLYALALLVLSDAGLAETQYSVDPDLAGVPVPYAWFDPLSHREALRRIAEAGLARLYIDRDGILRVQRYDSLIGGSAVGSVTGESHILKTDNPQKNSQVVNAVEVEAKPLKLSGPKVIYEQVEAVTVPAGGTRTMTVFFTDKPALNVSAPALSGAVNTVVSAWTAYAWGGRVVLSNPGPAPENITFTVTGTPLVATGRILARAEDATRVAAEGIIKARTIRNDLIQTQSVAQSIADGILAVFANAAKDVTSQIRGNPAIETGDRLTWDDGRASVTGDHIVIRHELRFDGGLTGTLTGRKVT